MIINIVALEMLGDRMPKLGSGLASFSLLNIFLTKKLFAQVVGGRRAKQWEAARTRTLTH